MCAMGKRMRDWSVTQKKIYHRCYSGMVKSNAKGVKTWFLTLTTNPVSVDCCDDWKDRFDVLQDSFRLFYWRVVRKYGHFDYLSVRVAEAYGVIHLVYRGVKMGDRWISDNWNEIHGSHIIDNRCTREGDRGAAQYMASQYFGGQSGKLTYGMSKDWIYPGAIDDYLKFKRIYKDYSSGYINEYGILCGKDDPELLYGSWRDHLNYKFGGDVVES